MSTRLKPFLRRLRRDQNGATFVFAALATMMLVGFGAITVDLGNAYRVQRQLQSSADAAALAGAMTIYNGGTATNAQTAATTWSAASGDKNALSLISVTASPTAVSCTGPTGSTCSANSTSPNGIKVTETANVPAYFGPLLGIHTLPVSATSYAIGNTGSSTCSGCGGLSQEADVMVLVDTTQSMGSSANSTSDPSCANKTNEQCAMLGVQSLLTDLTAPSNGSGGATVGLMTFPGVRTAADAAKEYCSGGSPSSSNIAQYGTGYSSTGSSSASATSPYYATVAPSGSAKAAGPFYLIYPTGSSLASGGGFDGNFKTNSGTLNTSDDLVVSAYGNSGSCAGLTAYGGAGTSLAPAMQEATAILYNDGRTGAAKYLVVLSDGDANSSASMPSGYSITDPTTNNTFTAGHDECHQALAASRIAQNDGITVIILGYGEETTNANGNPAGCNTDTGSYLISPCTVMMDMASVGNGTASSPQFFYSDANSSGSNACPSPANPTFASVNQIFESIANVIIGGTGATAGSAGGLPHLIPAS